MAVLKNDKAVPHLSALKWHGGGDIPFTHVAWNLHKIFLTLTDIDFVFEVPEFAVGTSKSLVFRKNTCTVYSYERLLEFLYLLYLFIITFIEPHGFLKGQQSTALLNTTL